MDIYESRTARRRLGLTVSPAAAFVALSLIFGSLIIVAAPPLRGPDETAHFLRAYGIAQGDLVPSVSDARGRKGVFLPPRLYHGFEFFETIQLKEKGEGWSGYGPVFSDYFSRPPAVIAPDAPAVFVPYAGSEGYSPIPYLPQVAAALLARIFDLEFFSTFYLMRFAGLAAVTAVIAYATARAWPMGWTLVAIAMLPTAVYGRSVISTDGSALAGAMVVTVLCLRAVMSRASLPGQTAAWMALNALTKPTNVALVLLALITPARQTGWGRALTILPAVAAALLWTLLSGADTASWRMVEITGREPEAFDPLAKLLALFTHPWRFPAAAISTLTMDYISEWWRELIGVLGLFDTVLQAWVYPTVSVLLLALFFTRLPLTPPERARVAIAAAVTTWTYGVAVFLVCYLVFTPADAELISGVQGRYFVPVLPAMAILIAALANRGLDQRLIMILTVVTAVLSGGASIQAILDTDWHL